MLKKSIVMISIFCLGLSQFSNTIAEETTRFIEVQGESLMSLVPNEVHISITVERQDFNLRDAKEKASKATRKIIELAKDYQKDSKQIETNFVNVQPRHDNEHNKQEFLGYFAQSSLTIVFTDEEAYYKFMHKLPSVGGEYTSRTWYELGKTDQINIEIQQKAVENAKNKAEALAKTVGASLGNVLQIRDVMIQKENGRFPIMMMAKSSMDSSPQPDMEAGLRDVRAYATVRFELK